MEGISKKLSAQAFLKNSYGYYNNPELISVIDYQQVPKNTIGHGNMQYSEKMLFKNG